MGPRPGPDFRRTVDGAKRDEQVLHASPVTCTALADECVQSCTRPGQPGGKLPDGPKLKDGWQAELKVPEGPNGAPEGPNGMPEGPNRARGDKRSLKGQKEPEGRRGEPEGPKERARRFKEEPHSSTLSGLSAYLKQGGLPKTLCPIHA